MPPERWRRALAACGVVLVSGCTPEMKQVPLGTKPAAPSTQPSAAPSTQPSAVPSVATAPSYEEDDDPATVALDERAVIQASGHHRTVKRVSDGDTIVVDPGRPDIDHI